MPELPDVETFRSYFEATSLNKYIQTIHARHSRVLKSSISRLQRSLEGHSFDFIKRRGKYLFAKIKSGGFLLIHFGMTGFLKYYRNEEKKPDHIELLVDFSNGFHLAYISKRKFGKLDLIEDIDEYCKKAT